MQIGVGQREPKAITGVGQDNDPLLGDTKFAIQTWIMQQHSQPKSTIQIGGAGLPYLKIGPDNGEVLPGTKVT